MYFDLFVTNVEKEGPFLKIWGQKNHKAATDVERCILEHLEMFEKGEGLCRIEQLHMDLLCCARYTDGSYYRARIIELDVPNGFATCLFIDYGNKDRVPISDLRVPSTSKVLFRIPAQSSSFILSGIVGTWDSTTLRLILDKIGYEEVKSLVVKTVGSRSDISLLKLYHEGRDFIETLVHSGLGSPVPQDGFEVMIWTQLAASNPGQMTIPTNYSSYPNVNMMNMMNQWQQMMMAGMSMMPPSVASLPTGPSSLPIFTSPALSTPVDMRKEPAKKVVEPLTRFSAIKLENDSEHKVFISHIEKGTVSFAAQLLTYDKELKDMMAALNSPNVSFQNLKPPYMPGIICLAKYSEDDTYCRAVITGVDNDRVLVYFVDYGNSEAIKVKDLYEIPAEYTHPKMMALQFTLAGLQDVNCTDEIKQVFSDVALEKDAILRIVPPKFEECTKQLAELFIDDSNVKELINVELLKKRPRVSKLQLQNVEMPNSGCTVKAVVAYVKSTANFFVQLASQQDALQKTMAQVAEYCQSSARKMTLSDIQPGAICCARFPADDQWYRALIINSEINDLTVMYVDYGNEEKVLIDDLRIADPKILELRAQAIPCCLSGFEQRAGDEALSSRFEDMTLENSFTMKVVQLKKEVPCLVVCLLDETGTDIAKRIAPSPVNGYASEEKHSMPSSTCRDPPAVIATMIDQRDVKKVGRPQENLVSGKAGGRFEGSSERGFNREERVENGFKENNFKSSAGRTKERDDNFPKYDCFKKDPAAWGIGRHDRYSKPIGHCDRDGDVNYGDRPSENKFSSSGTNRSITPGRCERQHVPSQVAGEDSWDDSPAPPPTLQQMSIEIGLKRPVDLVYSTSPSDFYLQERTSSDGLQIIMDQISEKYTDGGELLSIREIAVGTVCVAKYSEDDTWYRAVVKKVTSEGVEVFFSDYGNTEMVNHQNLKKIDSSMVSLKGQAIHCELMGIPNSSFSDDKLEEFSLLSDSETLEAEFVQCNGDIYSVILKDTSRVITVNESFGATVESMLAPTSIVSSIKPLALTIGDVQNVTVSWFSNPGRFYLSLKSSEDNFKAMMHKLNKDFSKKNPLPLVSPAIGQTVVARYKDDNALYRGQVKVQKGDKYGIQYVDYGNRSLVNSTSIYGLEHQYASMPSQAILCSLQGVKPIQGEWGKVDLNIRECFEGSNLTCAIVSESHISDEVCYVVRMSRDGQDLTEELILKKLAEAAEELPLPLLPEFPVDPQLLIDQTLKVYVDSVEEQSLFVIELDCLKIREELSKNLTVSQVFSQLTPDKAHCGQQCLVFSQHHQEYRRAVITDDKAAGGIAVRYMDFSASEEVSCQSLFILPPNMSGPALVIECSVANASECAVGQHITLAFQSCSQGRLFARMLKDADIAAKSPLPMPIIRRKMKVSVSHASGATVWIQQAQQADYLSGLLDNLFELHEEGSEHLASPNVGTLCAAKSLEDDNWYRAVIEDVFSENVLVRYCDYGNTETIPKQNLKILGKQFLDIPMLAAKMTLPIITDDLTLGECILQKSANKQYTAVVVKEKQEWFVELLDGKQEFSIEMIRTGRALSMKDSPFPAILAEAPNESSLSPGVPASAVVSYAISTAEFYIQEEKDLNSLDEFQADLQAVSNCMRPVENLQVGSMCLALYEEDSTWYRGLVMADKKIFFVDYGNSENVQIQNIKVLPPAMVQKRSFAVKCCLKTPEGKRWSGKANERLTELIVEPEESVTVTVVSSQKDCKVVDISTSSGNVVDILANEGLLEDVKGKSRVYVTSVESPSDFQVAYPDSSTPDGNQTLHCALYLPSDICEWSQAAITHFKEMVAGGSKLFDLEILIPGDVAVVSLSLNGKKIDEELVALCHQESPKDTAPSLQAEVVFANSPSDFYVHLSKDGDAVEEMAESLQNAESFAVYDNTDAVCAALFPEDGLWYRARVIDKQPDGHKVQFIDFGNVSIVSELRTLPSHLVKIPSLALHCCLPLPHRFGWSDSACEKFQELTSESEAALDIELLSSEEPFITNISLAGVNVAEELAQLSDIDVSKLCGLIGTLRTSLQGQTEGVSILDDECTVSQSGVSEEYVSRAVVAESPQYVEADSSCITEVSEFNNLTVEENSLLPEVEENSPLPDTTSNNIDDALVNAGMGDGEFGVDCLGTQEVQQEEAFSSQTEELSVKSEDSIVEVDLCSKAIPIVTIDDSDDGDVGACLELPEERLLENSSQVTNTSEYHSIGVELGKTLESADLGSEDRSLVSKDLVIENSEDVEKCIVEWTTYPNSVSCELDVGGVSKGLFLARALDFQSDFQLCIPGSVVYRFEDCQHHGCTIDVSSSVSDASASK